MNNKINIHFKIFIIIICLLVFILSLRIQSTISYVSTASQVSVNTFIADKKDEPVEPSEPEKPTQPDEEPQEPSDNDNNDNEDNQQPSDQKPNDIKQETQQANKTKTSDDTSIGIWILLAVVNLAIIIELNIYKYRYKKNKYE